MDNAHQCSAEFTAAFDAHAGSCRQTCQCGRVFFDDENDGISWEEGELDELRAKAARIPDKYIPAGGSVSWMEVDGKIIVWGCKCDTARRYDEWIITHARQLVQYLRLRSERLKKESADIAL